ncbi:uncharacterized protein METZ01_LOCUS246675 [marine metagenome]|uniref:DUF3303 domain-containing protein n=1 Tax=marine metagenome TaxID=408172 RepID=A0A382I534_9ZZZZ
MKFMLTWQLHAEAKMDALAAFSQMTPEDDAGDHGPDITMIGRWHDLPSGSGVCILESDSAEAVAGWAYNWGAALNAKVIPVLDDAEIRAVVSAKLAG